MEPITSAIDKLNKSLVQCGQDFISGLVRRRKKSSSRSPIEILKRLQREAFSDLMKLRDRLDKVEKVLTFYRTSKGGPFEEEGTQVKGEVDLLGALLLVNDLQRPSLDEISRAGIRTGIVSRITFETRVREKDAIEAEFITGLNSQGYSDDTLGRALSIAKVGYTANFADWFSLFVIPMGARCRDIAVSANSSEERGLTDYSSYGPPLLHQQNGSAIGLMVRRSNAIASLAQFVSELQIHPTIGYGDCFTTFGQIVCKLPKSTKLSLFGLHQVLEYRSQGNLGPLTIPLGTLKSPKPSETTMEASAPPSGANSEIASTGSVALMLECELDESVRLAGWVQWKNLNPKCIQWAANMFDSSKDEIGWGLSLGGMVQGPANQEHFQVEASLKFKVGKRFTLQPGITYVMDGTNQMPAIMFRSTWFL